ncbi:MAG TPA: TlpA disulfide reductase family protein [Thermodesulfobacteriota bacterium]|nr:TlpA disulfide reductase family protein [Thermodesulfobacteriota bacterium]
MEASSGKIESKKGSNLIAVLVVLAAVTVVLFFVLSQKQRFTPVVAGNKAPDFTLPDLKGNPVSLNGFKGKVVFLNFWATWCKPCEEEMPSMQLLYNALKSQNQPFEIVAVSIDSEGPEVVQKFIERYNITFTVLHDRKGRIKDTYKTTGVPETFIIDQGGIIAEKVWGPRDWRTRDSVKTIMDLLENGPTPPESSRN